MSNVFISWSGEKSKEYAILLSDWIPSVLQSVEVFISTEIDKGKLWMSEIGKALDKSTFGLICLTPDNLNSPWLLFETGALYRGLNEQSVCTVLFDVNAADVRFPLAGFQNTRLDEKDFFKLIQQLNSSLEKPLDSARLKVSFDTFWPHFFEKCEELMAQESPSMEVETPRTERSILEEILQLVRSNNMVSSFGINHNLGLLASLKNNADGHDFLTEIEKVNFTGLLGYPDPNKNPLRRLLKEHDAITVESTLNDYLKGNNQVALENIRKAMAQLSALEQLRVVRVLAKLGIELNPTAD